MVALIENFAFPILKVVQDYPTHQTQKTDSKPLPTDVRQNLRSTRCSQAATPSC